MTAHEIIEFSKTGLRKTGNGFVSIKATKKIKGHTTTHLEVKNNNIYDCWVYGSGKSGSPIERIDLRDKSANAELSKYFK